MSRRPLGVPARSAELTQNAEITMRKILFTVPLLLVMAGTWTLGADERGASRRDREDRGGLVYVMTNDSGGNEVVVFIRDRRGRLHRLPGAVPTGGEGASDNAAIDPLGSQNSLVHDRRLDRLFAVNAGDNTVTAFDTSHPIVPLRRTARVSSGGFLPVSLAVSGNLLYVLNAGGTGAVTTFAIGGHGELTRLGVLELGLSNATTVPFDQVMAPGQVGVDALARRLIVTNGGGQELLLANLDDRGVPLGPLTSTATPGVVPFAFDVTRNGIVLVAEAGSSSVSAFDGLSGIGSLPLTAGAVPNGQAATCWIAVHRGGHVYVANTGANNLSLYRVTRTGDLQLVDAMAARAGDAPADLTFAGGGGFLYALNLQSGSISGFTVNPATGALRLVDTQDGLPAGAGIQGIAARDF
jgi:6-phosphogluconolactonase (cycloisomerase 2 family)